MQCMHQQGLLIRRHRVVKYDWVSGVELLMMLLVWALYQMFVSHGTQIMLLLCVKEWRIKWIAKLGALNCNGIMCGREKKPRKFQKIHLRDLLRIFKTISFVRKSKKCVKRRASFRVASFQQVISLTTICLLKVNFKELEQGKKYAQS